MSANQPLDPNQAATLFYAGDAMAFTSEPQSPFVYGRWMSQPCMCVSPPFKDQPSAAAYFTTHPVILANSYTPPPPGEAAGATLKVSGAGWTARGTKMAVELPNGQRVDLQVSYTDESGNSAEKPGAITWSSSDENTATVNADDADDTRAVVSAVAVGTITVSAESGGITATLDVIVGAGSGSANEATQGTIEAGQPYDPGALR
jgi:hypothetical protein